jgi:hypothetical protein
MRGRRELIAKLAEYGVVASSVFRGLYITGVLLYSTVVSGALTYSIVLREPGSLGKIVLMSIILVLSGLVAWVVQRAIPLDESKKRRKSIVQPELSSRVLLLIVVLTVTVVCYTLICVYRAY